jgi:hypothetical protein
LLKATVGAEFFGAEWHPDIRRQSKTKIAFLWHVKWLETLGSRNLAPHHRSLVARIQTQEGSRSEEGPVIITSPRSYDPSPTYATSDGPFNYTLPRPCQPELACTAPGTDGFRAFPCGIGESSGLFPIALLHPAVRREANFLIESA